MDKQELIQGRVSFGANDEYRVLLDGNAETAALPSGTLRTYCDLPAIGDWVWVRPAGELSLVEAVEPRKTAFVRKAAGRTHAVQCVAADIDVCFVVCGLNGELPTRKRARMHRATGCRGWIVSPDRWASYARLQREARHHALQADATSQRAEKPKMESNS